MNESYRPELGARVTTDAEGRPRHILQSELWQSQAFTSDGAAEEYLRSIAPLLQIPEAALRSLHQRVDFTSPRPQALAYRLGETKSAFDGTTYEYHQTLHNVPVWGAALAVTVKDSPARVVYTANTTAYDISVPSPTQMRLGTIKDHFRVVAAKGASTGAVEGSLFLGALLEEQGIDVSKAAPEIKRGRFYYYRYIAVDRLPAVEHRDGDEGHVHLTLPLPRVPDQVEEGSYRLVVETIFSFDHAGIGRIFWRALVDADTKAILYLRALVDGVNGLVFRQDPVTKTGVLTNTATQPNSTLNPLRDDVVLERLDAPSSGQQALRGTHVRIVDDDAPTVAPPTEPTGTDFDYDVRTDDFAAVNAYYHADAFFAYVAGLGFNLSTYFNGTTFPVRVDHRASYGTTNGVERNAFCLGDGDGIALTGYCLADTGNAATDPIGIALDKMVHWHELGGHGVLHDHVNGPNFGFAHSAGDGLAAIQNDPTSALRATANRFLLTPFVQLRRFDRAVTAGWAWGGSNDQGGYLSEEILATTHFRIYRSLGGDSPHEATRLQAARVATYLILRAIGTLTQATNPTNVLSWANTLQAVDLLDWTTEGWAGGAYNKVIRWAFEQQGLYQPTGAPTPVTQAGAPPAVDVYLDDGRGGEYTYQQVHWANPSIWNRNSADAGTTHQNAIMGQVNYAYARIKNRGTQTATNIVVRAYHCLPGAGLIWPNDFTEMSPSGITIVSLQAGPGKEAVVGPFEWTPNTNVHGHDCLLVIASTADDLPNTANFSVGDTIPEWRLVPHDNNVGQRNVTLVPGALGSGGLKSLDRTEFFVGNPTRRPAKMEVRVQVPALLKEHGWDLEASAQKFALRPGEKLKVVLALKAGQPFTVDQLRAAAEQVVVVSVFGNGELYGGMHYQIDPNLAEAAPREGPPNTPPEPAPCPESPCARPAAALLECLGIDNARVKSATISRVSVDIELHARGGCK